MRTCPAQMDSSSNAYVSSSSDRVRLLTERQIFFYFSELMIKYLIGDNDD
jgi:hypothetical protein